MDGADPPIDRHTLAVRVGLEDGLHAQCRHLRRRLLAHSAQRLVHQLQAGPGTRVTRRRLGRRRSRGQDVLLALPVQLAGLHVTARTRPAGHVDNGGLRFRAPEVPGQRHHLHDPPDRNDDSAHLHRFAELRSDQERQSPQHFPWPPRPLLLRQPLRHLLPATILLVDPQRG